MGRSARGRVLPEPAVVQNLVATATRYGERITSSWRASMKEMIFIVPPHLGHRRGSAL
jgi:hypothetical protein